MENTLSEEFLPIDIVKGTRGYVEKIARQANGCYKMSWYDACAVMIRRLIEILIIDSYDSRSALDDILETGHPTLSIKVSEQPTASEIRRFLNDDYPILETALNDVGASLGGSPLTNYSATSNWNTYISRLTDLPENVINLFDLIVKTRERAHTRNGMLTGKQLLAAKQGINKILIFLDKKFPSAGINLPDQGDILPLTRLIERYLAAPSTYWHIERKAKPALKKIKKIGDFGAHGRYSRVTKQTLDKYQDELITGIQQLVGTAYRN